VLERRLCRRTPTENLADAEATMSFAWDVRDHVRLSHPDVA
jgi:hypothetical protein